MSTPQENIEALLCAYVEGELTPDQRAQLEKHLRANPSHQKLLADLMRSRLSLRGLPREAAPVDLLDAIHGSVERSVLLDDLDGEQQRADRPRAWSRYAAMAAVILIAAAGSMMVYRILPGGGLPPVAVSPLPVPPPVSGAPVLPDRTVDLMRGSGLASRPETLPVAAGDAAASELAPPGGPGTRPTPRLAIGIAPRDETMSNVVGDPLALIVGEAANAAESQLFLRSLQFNSDNTDPGTNILMVIEADAAAPVEQAVAQFVDNAVPRESRRAGEKSLFKRAAGESEFRSQQQAPPDAIEGSVLVARSLTAQQVRQLADQARAAGATSTRGIAHRAQKLAQSQPANQFGGMQDVPPAAPAPAPVTPPVPGATTLPVDPPPTRPASLPSDETPSLRERTDGGGGPDTRGSDKPAMPTPVVGELPPTRPVDPGQPGDPANGGLPDTRPAVVPTPGGTPAPAPAPLAPTDRAGGLAATREARVDVIILIRPRSVAR